MSDNLNTWSLLKKLSWQDVLLVVGVLVLASLLAVGDNADGCSAAGLISCPSFP